MKIYCPLIKAQGRKNAQAQASSPNPDAPKKNHFMLSNPKVIKRAHGIWLLVCYNYFPLYVYALLDSGATM